MPDEIWVTVHIEGDFDGEEREAELATLRRDFQDAGADTRMTRPTGEAPEGSKGVGMHMMLEILVPSAMHVGMAIGVDTIVERWRDRHRRRGTLFLTGPGGEKIDIHQTPTTREFESVEKLPPPDEPGQS